MSKNTNEKLIWYANQLRDGFELQFQRHENQKAPQMSK